MEFYLGGCIVNKKCIKIIFIFIIILYFLSTFCFADFQSYPDGYNLQQVANSCSSIDLKLSNLQNSVTSINTNSATANSTLSNIYNETTLCYNELLSIYNTLDNIEQNTTDLENYVFSLLAKCNQIYTSVDIIRSTITSTAQQTQNVISDTSAQTQNVISESAQQTQNVITNSSVSDDTMVIDTDDMDIEDSEGVYDFFTSFLDTMKNTFSGVDTSVSTISIPLGFVDGTIDLRSDIISSVISGTYIATLVQLFWYFVFGTYYIILTKRILDYLSTGQIAVGGVTGFIKFLDGQNQIIKTYMM